MIRTLFVLSALLLAVRAPAAAQTSVPVRPEQEVRIQAPQSGLRRLTIATVMSVSADTVVVQTAVRDTIRDSRVLRQFAVPMAHVRRLQVLSGTHDRAGGLARGAVVGTGVGVLGALFHKQFSRRDFDVIACDPFNLECPFPSERRLYPYDHGKSAVIIGTGAVLGMVVGGLKPGRRWESVLPRPADAFAAPAWAGACCWAPASGSEGRFRGDSGSLKLLIGKTRRPLSAGRAFPATKAGGGSARKAGFHKTMHTAQATRWQYTMLTVDVFRCARGHHVDVQQISGNLNQFGGEGWELVRQRWPGRHLRPGGRVQAPPPATRPARWIDKGTGRALHLGRPSRVLPARKLVLPAGGCIIPPSALPSIRLPRNAPSRNDPLRSRRACAVRRGAAGGG
jgi:hypothetical protein